MKPEDLMVMYKQVSTSLDLYGMDEIIFTIYFAEFLTQHSLKVKLVFSPVPRRHYTGGDDRSTRGYEEAACTSL